MSLKIVSNKRLIEISKYAKNHNLNNLHQGIKFRLNKLCVCINHFPTHPSYQPTLQLCFKNAYPMGQTNLNKCNSPELGEIYHAMYM